MPPETDDQLLDTLTPEERAAIEDTEMSAEELAAMQAIADEDGADDDDGDDDGDDDSAEGAVPAATPAAAAETPAADPSTNDPAPAAATPEEDKDDFAPTTASRYRAELPADFQERSDAVAGELTALGDKFRSGEIDFEEFSRQQSEVMARRDELNSIKIKADIANEMGAQSAEDRWSETVKNFTAHIRTTESIDYATDAAKQRDLDIFVKALAGDEKNADKSMSWFLREAHKRVLALHGVATAKPTPAADEGKPTKPAPRTPATASIPKTLAHVPGGDGPGDVGGEFAHLDGLEGMDLEDAIAKMAPAQREKYLSGAL